MLDANLNIYQTTGSYPYPVWVQASMKFSRKRFILPQLNNILWYNQLGFQIHTKNENNNQMTIIMIQFKLFSNI